MRDEVLDTLNANEHWWRDFSRREIVARAMSAGIVAGWNARNANDAADFERMREKLRLEMTSGHRSQQAEPAGRE